MRYSDSGEEAVAFSPHPPALGRVAFVRHAAGCCCCCCSAAAAAAAAAALKPLADGGWMEGGGGGGGGARGARDAGLEPNEGSFSVVAGSGIAADGP